MTELGLVAGSSKRLRCVFEKKNNLRHAAAVVKLPSLFLVMILFQKQCEMVIKEVTRVQADSCLEKGHKPAIINYTVNVCFTKYLLS